MAADDATDTVDAIVVAYRASMRRLGALDDVEFLQACLALGWEEMNFDTTLGDALATMASQGSIDAAAALNILAVANPEPEHELLAQEALRVILVRNEAARAGLVECSLVALLEEAAADLGYVPVVDPATGETRWRAP